MAHRQLDQSGFQEPENEISLRNPPAAPPVASAAVPSVRPDHNKFDPCLSTREGSPSRFIADAVRRTIEEAVPRRRQRRPRDADIFVSLVDAIVANLIDNHLRSGASAADDQSAVRRWVSVPLSGRHLRKGSTIFPNAPVPLSSLPDRLGEMESLGFIVLERAPRHEKADWVSRMRTGPALVALIAEHKPKLHHLARQHSRGQDGLIELRERDPHFTEEPNRPGRSQPKSRTVPFAETAQTRRWAAEIAAINTALAEADISFDAARIDVEAHPALQLPIEQGIELHDRRLRRIFNNGRLAFDHGGRLYGGFWQRLPRELRPGLRIGGEPVVLLDYRSMFLQLLYALKARMQPPLDGDLYEGIDPIDGWPDDPAQTAMMRDSIKRNVNALLFARARPAGRRPRLVKGTRSALSKGVDGAELERRIKVRHPEIAEWIGTDVGYELMHHESEIMVRILLRCLDQGVIILPLHDGLMVAESQWMVAREAMHAAFYSYTGGMFECVEGPVQLAP